MNVRVQLAVPFAVGIPDAVSKGLLGVLAKMGVGAANGPQGAGNILTLVAQDVDLDLPDSLVQQLEDALSAITGGAHVLGPPNPITGGGPTPAPVPEPAPVSTDTAENQIGFDSRNGGMCLSWVQDQLGIPHEYATAYDAWIGYQARGYQTSNPQTDDLVFFDKAASNKQDGHVGRVTQPGRFTSIWSDGRIMDAPIDRFARDNAAPVLGYISTAAIRGVIPWPQTLLQAAGLPVNAQTIGMVEAWAVCEGGNSHNNPTNVTAPLDGSWSWAGQNGFWNDLGNGFGVVTFDNVHNGATACGQNLGNGPQYAGLRAAMAQGSARAFAHDAGLGVWGTNPACVQNQLGV